MGEPALAFLLELVKEVVKEYKDVISGAEIEFEHLENDLKELKGLLNKVAKDYSNSNDDGPLKVLERQIRNLVYEVEDTIDTCLTKATEAKAKSKARRISKPKFMGSSGFSLAKEVILLRDKKVKPLLDGAKLQFASMQQTADRSISLQDQRTKLKRDKPIREHRVIGFDGEEETIIGYLRKETQSLEVIPIIGIPGQGKTTLAWKVYQNETVCYDFPIRIWVYISQKFNSRDVFLHILKTFAPSTDTSKMLDVDLVQAVRSCLEKDKFLLVLDDVWNVDAWEEIKGVLPLNNGKGKVIITSREDTVGYRAATVKPHKLKFLNEAESWMLLQLEVYGNEEDCPSDMRGIGQHLANECDGVPLIIIVIGGVLVDQLASSMSTMVAKKKWETMAENLSNALQNEQRITDVVALSYERLSNDLRDCFVYIGVFPEDYEIPVRLLSGLWIAEGFILPKEGKSLEQIAEENVDDLICRNLLKVDKKNHMGKVKTCRVHDMIRAFCISKSKDQNLFQHIKVNKQTHQLEPPVPDVEKLHRLCFQSDLSTFLSKNPTGTHIRSFLCFYEQSVELDKNHLTVIPDGFPKLRILESKTVKFPEFPGKVQKLIHLRYLTLHVDNLEKLPKSISQLWNLQVLVAETKSRFITMEANMWKMIWLRHVKTKAAIRIESNWEGEAGQNLQTLERLSPESCTEAVYKRAKNLKTLGISGNLANLFGKNFLIKLNHLEKLKLVNNITFEATSDDVLHLPLDCFPPWLKRLTLMKTYLDWQHMSTLAMIRSLEVLKLKDNAFVGLSWNASDYKFPNLQLLVIANTDLVLWDASPDSFPSLRVVVLKSCESLIEIPHCVGKHLEKLAIERLRKTAVESARKIRDEKDGKPQGKFAIPFVFEQCPVCEKM
ncbi:putative late blight resistance protein homolog R1A-10 [Salvia hispanica]|uniref:putative late blight resistance protein homolog R1A-10 n=1 Tax=Salvia hispanica TaxID=49212 RepID=UPI00200990FF|nr:putative late blight resistance protein homolog R1A-10 [Salvia hispanica]